MKILITGAWREAKEHIAEIENMGYSVDFMQWEDGELPANPEIYEAVICCRLFKFHPVEEFINLKFIQTESAGYDRVPMDYCKEHDIPVYNIKDAYATPMSEYIICHLLDWYQDTSQELNNREDRGWEKKRSKQELTGKHVLIIGTGHVAKYTAKKLQAFDCKVVAVSHTPREVEYMDKVVSYDKLSDNLGNADIVIVATQPGDKPIITDAELEQMKKSAVLVNVSRGVNVDEDALCEALSSGSIEAAILDVYKEEPLPSESLLWELPNAILTPHSSYLGEGNAERLWGIIKERLEEKR